MSGRLYTQHCDLRLSRELGDLTMLVYRLEQREESLYSHVQEASVNAKRAVTRAESGLYELYGGCWPRNALQRVARMREGGGSEHVMIPTYGRCTEGRSLRGAHKT